jgi:TPR repeat protein
MLRFRVWENPAAALRSAHRHANQVRLNPQITMTVAGNAAVQSTTPDMPIRGSADPLESTTMPLTMPLMYSRNYSESPVSGILRGLLAAIVLLLFMHHASAQSPRYTEAFNAYQNQKFDQAESIWLELANGGDVNARYALGVMHLRGEAGDASPAKAFAWFEKAAEQGHATAMFNLGVAYWEGSGVATDRKKALALWEESADKGDSGAQFNLGLAYYIGEERETDFTLAAEWVGRAAEQNHPEAKRILELIETERERARAGMPEPVITDDSVALDSTGESTNSAISTTAGSDAGDGQPTRTYWRTTNRSASLYDRPDGTVFREIPPGTPLEVKSRDGDWAWITLPEGLRTWVYARFIDVNGDSGVIHATAVRVRPKPSTDNAASPPLGTYPTGAKVRVLRQDGEWVEIRAPESIGAWLRAEDMTSYEDTAANRDAEWERARAAGV